jgi:hypothetical protein
MARTFPNSSGQQAKAKTICFCSGIRPTVSVFGGTRAFFEGDSALFRGRQHGSVGFFRDEDARGDARAKVRDEVREVQCVSATSFSPGRGVFCAVSGTSVATGLQSASLVSSLSTVPLTPCGSRREGRHPLRLHFLPGASIVRRLLHDSVGTFTDKAAARRCSRRERQDQERENGRMGNLRGTHDGSGEGAGLPPTNCSVFLSRVLRQAQRRIA